ncbi:MAG: beta-propeller domain-containing protein [Thermoplasmata archaeon]|nr:MAG: beta-propeller domain-containing protein [Thermoplasmata archaeon]
MNKGLIALIIVVSMVLGGIVGIYALSYEEYESDGVPSYEYQAVSYSSLKKFHNYQEIVDYLDDNSKLSQYYYSYYYKSNLTTEDPSNEFRTTIGTPDSFEDSDSSGSGDHSETNVQVEGVDEGDIVKNDGKYAYIVSRNLTKVFILQVYPAEEARILSIIQTDWTIYELYLYEDKLVVLGASIFYYDYFGDIYEPYYSYTPITRISVYDIEDKENPVLFRSEEIECGYVTSRMIGNYFYAILTQYTYQVQGEDDLPVPASQVYYTDDYDYYYVFTTIMSLNVQDKNEEPNIEVVLTGSSTHIYVSLHNIYLTGLRRMSWVEKMERRVVDIIIPSVSENTSTEIEEIRSSDDTRYEKLQKIDQIVGEYREDLDDLEEEQYEKDLKTKTSVFEEKIQREIEKTTIHRISIFKGEIKYRASGGVPGYVLNRFSMDEYNEHFRIATTTGQVWGSGNNEAKNHVFAMNLDLNVVGMVLDIAPGEMIYSARFVKNRGYLVTFKKVDPFFVLDLSDPRNLNILGELKIPGYSNYLHPYDENHVIGIGKDAVDMGDFAWYLGVKLSLFDVTDVHNPKEISNYIIGDRGTESLALSDPHAFLFSRNKNLLVIPVQLREIDEDEYPDEIPPNAYGKLTWYGAYVFHISAEHGIDLKGGITHDEDFDPIQNNYGDWNLRVKRSFYIENVLYTVSNTMIKANNLDHLSEIKVVAFPD